MKADRAEATTERAAPTLTDVHATRAILPMQADGVDGWIAPAENRERAIALKLTVVARQLGRRFDQGMESLGVSPAKWRLIAAVARRPGATQRLISELLEVTEVTAGRLVERLCADGYLERREDPADRRAHRIYLTPAAQPLLDSLSEQARICEQEAFVEFQEQDFERLEALLDTLAKTVARMPPR